MKNSNQFDQIVYGYWARRFGCDRSKFLQPGTLFFEEESLSGHKKVNIYNINRMSVLRIGPQILEETGLRRSFSDENTSITWQGLCKALEDIYRVKLESTLLDCFLAPKDFRPYRVDKDLTARRIHPLDDDLILRELYGACTEKDLDEAEIYVDEPDPVIYGLFDGGKMVAYASHRYWDEVIADIGVLVHPRYRNRGLGKGVVSVLCAWCIENDVVPMYRVFSDHAHSIQIAKALGFKELVNIETLQLIPVMR